MNITASITPEGGAYLVEVGIEEKCLQEFAAASILIEAFDIAYGKIGALVIGHELTPEQIARHVVWQRLDGKTWTGECPASLGAAA
jgi:hypothetical protein